MFKLSYKETMTRTKHTCSTNMGTKKSRRIWIRPWILFNSDISWRYMNNGTLASGWSGTIQIAYKLSYITIFLFCTKHTLERSDHLLLNWIWATLFPINYRDCGAIFTINWRYFFSSLNNINRSSAGLGCFVRKTSLIPCQVCRPPLYDHALSLLYTLLSEAPQIKLYNIAATGQITRQQSQMNVIFDYFLHFIFLQSYLWCYNVIAASFRFQVHFAFNFEIQTIFTGEHAPETTAGSEVHPPQSCGNWIWNTQNNHRYDND